MDEKTSYEENVPRRERSWGGWIVGGVAVALACGTGFLLWRTTQMEDDIRLIRASMQEELSAVQERATSANQTTREAFDAMVAELRQTRQQVGSESARARSIAQKHAEKLVATLEEKQLAKQEAFGEEVSSKFGELKQSAEATTAQLTGIVTDVGTVRGQVTETKSELSKTIADLKTVRGDMGVQSGLIATNSKELSALRELGERNYFEFDINRKSGPVKVSNLTLTLKKADVKRNKYNVDVVADDRRLEKRDRTINEPVQLYVSGGRQPYEIVVNQVHKDRIVGYLATPKVIRAQR